ncbi:MAG: VWA domain-containing protein [Planctomycetota bacterium]
MTQIRYLDWKQGRRRFADRDKLLRRLFSQLLVKLDGDAEEALEQLQWIGEHYGLFDDDYTFEDFKRGLLRDRLVRAAQGGVQLTPRGERFVRTESLDQVFNHLKSSKEPGNHRTPYTGPSAERLSETRPYRFGDDVANIDFNRSFTNALRRYGDGGPSLIEDDLEVYETEQVVSVATVLLVDISHSMILYGEDRITPAKRVALALTELTLSKYPKDAFHVVLFGDDAREIPIRDLAYCGVGPYHTNTCAGLRLARHILMRKKHANKQVFMITDGKPTALFQGNELYLNPFGLDRKIVAKTLDEAAECRRHGIVVSTFMLARDPDLMHFVERLTEVNHGRAYFSALGDLEQSVLVDFLRNRHSRF